MKFDVIRPCIVSLDVIYSEATNCIEILTEDEVLDMFEVDNAIHATRALDCLYIFKIGDTDSGIWDTEKLCKMVEKAIEFYKGVFKGSSYD